MKITKSKTKRVARRWITRSVCLSPETFGMGKQRAAEVQRNFSSYVSVLIRSDFDKKAETAL